jgi:hypothetical protein
VRVTLIGHATLLFETSEATVLVDPVLSDPFEGGAVSSWPERVVDLAALPRPDYVVVSHRHPDHFDIPSLAMLPTDATALIPRDPLLAHALERLGWKRIQALDPHRPLSSFDLQIAATPSEEPVIEVGLVVADSSGAVFDQVDTAPSSATIAALRARFRLTAHFARYASQNFEYFESRHTAFPWAEHARNLETAAALSAELVVPGSAGFRFTGAHAWLNRFLFPVSRRAFLADLLRVAPELRGDSLDPGDVLEVEGGAVRVARAASPFVRTRRGGDEELRFDPTAQVPDLTDPNPEARSATELADGVRRIVGALAQWALAPERPLSVPWRYRRGGVPYGLEVVFPDGGVARFVLDLGVAPKLHDLGGASFAPEPTVVHRIAASALVDWAERRRDFFSVRAYSRRCSTARHTYGDAAGVTVTPLELPDLLMFWLLSESEGAEDAARRRVDRQIAEVRRPA